MAIWNVIFPAAGSLSRGTIFFTRLNVILMMKPVPGSQPRRYGLPSVFITNTYNMEALAVDEAEGFIYWIDTHGDYVGRARFDGSDKTNGYVSGKQIVDIVVDDGKLYIGNRTSRKTEVISLYGSRNRTQIEGAMYMQCVTVDHSNRLLFYGTYHIHRATLDGKENERIVSDTGVVTGLDIDYCTKRLCWTAYQKKHLECSDYSGNDRRVYNTTGKPKFVVIQDGVAYYTMVTPESDNSVNALQLDGGSHTSFDLGSYGRGLYFGIVILHKDFQCASAYQPVLDPPVAMEESEKLTDNNNATCLVLAQTKMYTFSASTSLWTPQSQGKCMHPGFTIRRRVLPAIRTHFTVTISGQHLVCSMSRILVMVRQTKFPECEIAGHYRKCKLTGTTEPENGVLTTCVAQCTCDGDDCKDVTINIPKLQDNWEICEIDIK